MMSRLGFRLFPGGLSFDWRRRLVRGRVESLPVVFCVDDSEVFILYFSKGAFSDPFFFFLKNKGYCVSRLLILL